MVRNKLCAVYVACFIVTGAITPFLYQSVVEATIISVELTPAQSLALYGSTISATYCEQVGDYRSTSFEYCGTVSGIFSSQSYMNTVPAGTPSDILSTYSAANAFTYLVYKCQATAYNSSSTIIDFQFEINPVIDLSTHQLITSMMFSVASGNMGSSYENYRPHWYWTDSGDNLYDFSCRSQYNSLYSQGLAYFTVSAGDFVIDNEVTNTSNCNFRPIPVKFSDDVNVLELSSNFVDVFGSIVIPMDDGSSSYYMLLQCPILADGYINNVPGSGDSGNDPVTPGTGIGQGTIDSDGNISITIPDYSDQLQDIIDILDEIAEAQGYDDLTSDQIASSDLLDSASDVFNSDLDDYITAEESLYDNYNADSALNDWSYPELDSDILESSTLYTGLFNVQIIATMIWIVLSLSTIGFILFGKW